MNRLREFKEKHGKDFASKFISLKESDKAQYDTLNEDRRRFSHYFHTIDVMLDTGVMDEKFLQKLVRPGDKDQVDFLLEVIGPLEKEINSRYNTNMFVRLQEIYHKSLQ